MERLLRVLKAVGGNPWLRLVAAVVLLSSGLYEVLLTMEEELEVGVHHGAVAYGLVAVLKALPEALDGIVTLNEVHEGAHGG
jgi:hypothetical protein